MRSRKKQELNALNFGNDYFLTSQRLTPPPPKRLDREVWADEWTIAIHPHEVPGSLPVDHSVLNNLMQLVAAGDEGLELNESLRLVQHLLNRFDADAYAFRVGAGYRVAMSPACRFRFVMACPDKAEKFA